MSEIRILSGGAAAGVVQGLQADFEQQYQCKINGTFSAVGAMRDLVLKGEPCDMVILSKSLVDDLAASGHVQPESIRSLGIVPTGLAVPKSRTLPRPVIQTIEDVKHIFRSAPALYFPDMEKSTAGIHFMKVMRMLGLDEELKSRFKTFPNGATAMHMMSLDPDNRVVGGTQTTEINISPEVELIGLLPQEIALNTDYSLGICTHAKQLDLVTTLANQIVGIESLEIRQRIGYITP
jgi:molybdate transport system substrate-binding protein